MSVTISIKQDRIAYSKKTEDTIAGSILNEDAKEDLTILMSGKIKAFKVKEVNTLLRIILTMQIFLQ